jgi:hypothetical protein
MAKAHIALWQGRDHPSFWRWWAKSNGPLGRSMGAAPPRPENDFQQFKQFWAILEAINLVICTSCMPIVKDNVLNLSQPAVIVLFAPMLMHLLQYILLWSLSYVNHVYKLAQRDWNFPCSLFSLASCDTSSSTSIGSFASVVVPVSVSSSDQGFSEKMIFSVDFFQILGGILLSFDSFPYNRDPSMKNTGCIGWLYDWFTFSPDYVRGMKQKSRNSRNKIIIVCRSRLPVHDVQLYGPYVMVMHPTGTHITF